MDARPNALSIRLTEPVVFLRTSDPSGRHGSDPSDPPGLVRGLLTLNLTKPTRISSIEVELRAVVTSTWPEGAGPRRIDVTDEHTIYSTSTPCFRADDLSSTRRTASVGPGLSLMNANDYDHDCGLGIQRPPTYSATTDPSAQGRTRSQTTRHVNCDFSPGSIPEEAPTPSYSPNGSPLLTSPQSVTTFTTTSPPPLHVPSPLATIGIQSTPSNGSLRSSVNRDPSVSRRPSSEEDTSSSQSRFSPIRPRISQSPDHNQRHGSPYTRDTSTCETSIPRDGSVTRMGRTRSRFSLTTMLDVVKEVTGTTSRSRSRRGRTDDDGGIEETERGRPMVRTVGHTPQNLDVVPQPTQRPSSVQRESSHHFFGLGRVLGLDCDDDAEDDSLQGRKQGEGWKEFKKGTYTYPIVLPLPPNLPPSYTLPWACLSYTLRGVAHRPGAFTSKLACSTPFIVVSAPTVSGSEGGGGMGAGLPGDPGPVTVERIWEARLGYAVELSGRLLVIGAGDSSSSDARGASVGGQVDSGIALDAVGDDVASLQTSGLEESSQARIPVDGMIMLGINLAPLEKIKVWRLATFIDERVTYLSHNGRVGREDTLRRVEVWNVEDTRFVEDVHVRVKAKGVHSCKGKEKANETTKESIPLLPTPLSPHRSPLVSFIRPGTDSSELAGPGPYTLSTNIAIPSCRKKTDHPSIHFTIRHRNAGVRVEHTLRVVIRVERLDGSQDHTSDRSEEDQQKLFDIVMQIPVTVLSVEWQTLPRYCEVVESEVHKSQDVCPCELRASPPESLAVGDVRRLERVYTSDSGSSTFESGDGNGNEGDPLAFPAFAPVRPPSGSPSSRSSQSIHSPLQTRYSISGAPNADIRADGDGTGSPQRMQFPPEVGHAHLPQHGASSHDMTIPGPYSSSSPQPRSRMRGNARSPARSPAPTVTSRPPSPMRHEWLVSGQESEAGEAPPSYESAISIAD
ncbi:hypothetical protein V8B97DRAFT_2007174 [Scleroderma yunnanense]